MGFIKFCVSWILEIKLIKILLQKENSTIYQASVNSVLLKIKKINLSPNWKNTKDKTEF